LLHDTFAAFGGVTNARVMCDPDDGKSKGFGFVSFDSFESADMGKESVISF
jgi:splicing factor 3B subunit 4